MTSTPREASRVLKRGPISKKRALETEGRFMEVSRIPLEGPAKKVEPLERRRRPGERQMELVRAAQQKRYI